MRKIFPFQKIKIWPRITCQGLKKNGTKNWRKRTHHYFQPFFAQTVSFSRTFLSFLSLVMVWRPLCHSFYQARFPRPPRLSAWKFLPVTVGVHTMESITSPKSDITNIILEREPIKRTDRLVFWPKNGCELCIHACRCLWYNFTRLLMDYITPQLLEHDRRSQF